MYSETDKKCILKIVRDTGLSQKKVIELYKENGCNPKKTLDAILKKSDFLSNKAKEQQLLNSSINTLTQNSSLSSGISVGNWGTVNKLYHEEKFHALQGHGFAAERANHLYDHINGHNAKILGDNNAKNGADRIVDGIEIQSKYCAKGSKCVNECFENNGNGIFRYYTKNGHPMQIEVPSDKYEEAVQTMAQKIKQGQVKGVSDPSEAKNIIKKGHFTYEQAKNIAKAGTIESISYDCVNGIIISSSALGVSAMISFAISIWNGESIDIALKNATYSGIKIGGITFITSVLASQLSLAGLNSTLVNSSETIIGMIGPKASAILINAFRAGSTPLYGATAMKSAAKLLRGNIITASATVIIMSSFDIANIFRRRISGKQLFKNFVNTTSTVAGGALGWTSGAAVGSLILPGAGTIIGGIVGSAISGGVAGKATNAVLGAFIEDDAEEMVHIIETQFMKLASDYLLNEKEVENVVESLSNQLNGKKLKDMYANDNRQEFANQCLLPLIEQELVKRQKISVPSYKQINFALRKFLETVENN